MAESLMFLIAEHCDAEFYSGWHLYLRDNKNRQQRNADGDWGWIRGLNRYPNLAQPVLDELGIVIRGDGTCDDDGVAEIARQFPIPRQRVGGMPRGCIAVIVGDGPMKLAETQLTKKGTR